MHLFAQLPAAAGDNEHPAHRRLLCMGDEWYRFPSSFHLPGPHYRLGFVQTRFAGLLPLEFNQAAGGTAFAPAALNARNEAVPQQFVADPAASCDFWVGLDAEQPPAGVRWTTRAAAPFLDAARSPAPWRAFLIPYLSAQRNTFTTMRLLQRTHN
jgi:alpha-1,2-mannosyltransferase